MPNIIDVKENIIQKDMYYKEQLVMSYTIKYPEFISADCQKSLDKINSFYKTKAKMYEKFDLMKLYQLAVEEYDYSIANDFPVRKYEAFEEYEVTYNENCTISLYFDRYEYTGGAHGNTVRRADTWNVNNGKEIELNQFFPDISNVQEYIIKLINEQIENQIKAGDNYYFEDYSKLVTENFNKDSFYLTQDGVVIYFGQYDIAPYSSGIPTFTIPYSVGGATPPKCDMKY